MFARQPVFEDELQAYRSNTTSLDDIKGKESAVGSSSNVFKPKRKALANITNAKTDATSSGANAKSNVPLDAVKMPTSVPSAAICADGHLETPEKLAGPSGADQQLDAAQTEAQQLEDRVQMILRAIEGAADNGICDVSKDEDDVLQCFSDVCFNEDSPDPSEAQIDCDLFNTLPDMQTPNFLDLLEF